MQRMERKGYKTLMVVGSQPQAGTTTVAANLAISLAMSNRKVLIIDANIRSATTIYKTELNVSTILFSLVVLLLDSYFSRTYVLNNFNYHLIATCRFGAFIYR